VRSAHCRRPYVSASALAAASGIALTSAAQPSPRFCVQYPGQAL
jgi:hypothetical protein